MMKVGFPEFLWIWNRRQGLSTPTLHVEMARWLAERWRAGDRRLLLMAFRNSGKSSVVGLFCAWLLHQNPSCRILVLSGEGSLARKMTRNVRGVIERHPLTRRLMPGTAEPWAADQFTVRRSVELRDPSMLAKGVGANITGLRADVIVCDDVEIPNTCDTRYKREALRETLRELDYVIVPGGLQIYIGTPHTHESIYSRESHDELGEARPFLHDFARLELPIVDHVGVSRWPDRFSPERIAEIRLHSGPAKFESQMLLKPRNIADGRLDLTKLRRYSGELAYTECNREAILTLGDKRLVSASCWWDPAYGSPGRGDASVVAALFTDQDGNHRLHRVAYLLHDAERAPVVDEATQLCRQVAQFVGALFLPGVAIETNGIGRFLPGLLRRELDQTGVRCAVVEHTAKRNKDVRIIEAFDAVLAAGRLWAHDSVWETPFIEEMREWRPGAHNRDDGLDAVAGCLLEEPTRLPRSADRPRSRRDWRALGAVVANGDFEL